MGGRTPGRRATPVGRLLASVVCGVLASAVGACTTPGGEHPAPASAAVPGTPTTGSSAWIGEVTVAGDPRTRPAREAVVALVAARSAALAALDRAGWLATVADPSSDDGRRQATAYDNLVALGVRELRVAVVRDLPAAPWTGTRPDPATSPDSWSGLVDLQWSIPGFDSGRRTATRTLALALTPQGWRVARDHGSADQLQVWDLGPLHVERSATTLVAGDGDSATVSARRADADAIQGRLAAVFGAAPRAVLVVPADSASAARQLGRADAASLGSLAAATDGALGPDGRSTADRVVLNPDGFALLTDEGRRVVVAHELAHVAVRATIPGEVPTWLSEGLAEYLALQGVSIPDTVVAARLLDQVRASGAPSALPTTEDFDPTRPLVATAYQQAWLAVRGIAARYGEPTLLAFYRQTAGAGTSAGTADARAQAAMVQVLGTSAAQFLAAWQADLRTLAAA